jgi:hypothetical protein
VRSVEHEVNAKTPFSHEEYADIHFVYGSCNGNVIAVAEEYRSNIIGDGSPIEVFIRIHKE